MIEAKGGMMRYQNRHTQQGAVSLFVVIFTALLFTAITIGFTVLMLSDQQQATDNDLAQSALDSANAGTEDAKRVLAQYADCQERATVTQGNAQDQEKCRRIASAISGPTANCDTVSRALGTGESGERKIQQSEGDSALQQAYTCVKITPDTQTYVGKTRNEGDIRFIPLKTDGAAFSTVRIRWLAPSDMNLANGDSPEFRPIDPPAGLSEQEKLDYVAFPSKKDWQASKRGSVLRVGSVQYHPGAVNLDEIDANARAAFLYPSDRGRVTSGSPIDMAVEDLHRPLTAPNQNDLDAKTVNYPVQVRCQQAAEYMCETYLRLPNAGDVSVFSYLTLASVYRETSFEITLLDDRGQPVLFRNVQPEVDVTGRANNVFRRLVSRVESADASEAPYPRAAVGAGSDVCKDFLVTDDPDDYYTGAPTPPCVDIRNPETVTP